MKRNITFIKKKGLTFMAINRVTFLTFAMSAFAIKFDISTKPAKCHFFIDVSVGEYRTIKCGR